MPRVVFAGSPEIFHSVDVFGEGSVKRNHPDQIRIRVDQLPRRLVAVQPDKLVEQRPCEQHRVTLTALIRSERNLAVATPPLISHAIYRFGIYAGLIAEKNHNRIGSRIDRSDASAVRRGAPGAEDGIFNHLRISEHDLRADFISRAT